jgi:hypothetical protein
MSQNLGTSFRFSGKILAPFSRSFERFNAGSRCQLPLCVRRSDKRKSRS